MATDGQPVARICEEEEGRLDAIFENLESVLDYVNLSSDQALQIINNDLHYKVKEVLELRGKRTNRKQLLEKPWFI